MAAELKSLPPWASVKHSFERRRELGRGSFGMVHQAVLSTASQELGTNLGPGRNIALKYLTCTRSKTRSKDSQRLHPRKLAITAAEVRFAREAARIGGEVAN